VRLGGTENERKDQVQEKRVAKTIRNAKRRLEKRQEKMARKIKIGEKF
jgi:hypothetical protein